MPNTPSEKSRQIAASNRGSALVLGAGWEGARELLKAMAQSAANDGLRVMWISCAEDGGSSQDFVAELGGRTEVAAWPKHLVIGESALSLDPFENSLSASVSGRSARLEGSLGRSLAHAISALAPMPSLDPSLAIAEICAIHLDRTVGGRITLADVDDFCEPINLHAIMVDPHSDEAGMRLRAWCDEHGEAAFGSASARVRAAAGLLERGFRSENPRSEAISVKCVMDRWSAHMHVRVPLDLSPAESGVIAAEIAVRALRVPKVAVIVDGARATPGMAHAASWAALQGRLVLGAPTWVDFTCLGEGIGPRNASRSAAAEIGAIVPSMVILGHEPGMSVMPLTLDGVFGIETEEEGDTLSHMISVLNIGEALCVSPGVMRVVERDGTVRDIVALGEAEPISKGLVPEAVAPGVLDFSRAKASHMSRDASISDFLIPRSCKPRGRGRQAGCGGDGAQERSDERIKHWLADPEGTQSAEVCRAVATPAPCAASDATGPGAIVIREIGNKHTNEGKNVAVQLARYVGIAMPLVPLPDLRMVQSTLAAEFPHAAAIASALLKPMAACRHVRIRPTVFVGPPGCGKTSFAIRLLQLLGVCAATFPCGGVADAAIAGSARKWTGAEPSLPLSLALRHGTASPGIILDEIGRTATSRHNGNMLDALVNLLEAKTSSAWVDPYIQAPVDLSNVIWLATANDLDALPAALRGSRLTTVRFPAPRACDLRALAPGLTRDIAAQMGLDPLWVPSPDEVELRVLARHWKGGDLRHLQKLMEKIVAARDDMAMAN